MKTKETLLACRRAVNASLEASAQSLKELEKGSREGSFNKAAECARHAAEAAGHWAVLEIASKKTKSAYPAAMEAYAWARQAADRAAWTSWGVTAGISILGVEAVEVQGSFVVVFYRERAGIIEGVPFSTHLTMEEATEVINFFRALRKAGP